MAEIAFSAVDDFLQRLAAPGLAEAPAVFLIHGEEMLTKQVLEKLLERLLAGTSRAMAYEALEGLNTNVPEALARLNTYALLAGPRVVAFTDARVFYGRQDQARLREKVRKTAREGKFPKAAQVLMDLLGLMGHDRMDVQAPAAGAPDAWGFDEDDRGWLEPVIAHARDTGLRPASGQDPESELSGAIEEGFPPGNRLIITTDSVDKRRRLYKQILQVGAVIDCAVPRGDRKADRTAQEAVLNATIDAILQPHGKRLEPAARAALIEMTGFELRTLAGNTEKLVHYVGVRASIGVNDVQDSLVRTRKDPLYEFTDAVTDRDAERALFFLGTLLDGGEVDHPLPLLSAMVNQVRKLLVVKDFTASPFGRAWQPACPYPRFQQQVLPEVRRFDESLTAAMAQEGGPDHKTDLLLFPGGRSPFPLFKLLQKAERFTRVELEEALEAISQADRRLKSSGQNGRLILEHVLLGICHPAAGQRRSPKG
jgi:DNA polymerase-3 subunit delta